MRTPRYRNKVALVTPALVLTLGVFACSRSSDRASETHITSGTPPEDTLAAPLATQGADNTPMTPQDKPDGGARDAARPKTGGVTTGTQTGTTGNPNSGTTAAPDDGTVAPGHIMFPPEKGPGTGAPNSNGSHNVGSGAAPKR
jgi:hypothetical protein